MNIIHGLVSVGIAAGVGCAMAGTDKFFSGKVCWPYFVMALVCSFIVGALA